METKNKEVTNSTVLYRKEGNRYKEATINYTQELPEGVCLIRKDGASNVNLYGRTFCDVFKLGSPE